MSSDSRGSSIAGPAFAGAGALCYSLSSVVGKDLLGKLGVASMLLLRFGIAALVLLVILLVWRRRGGPDPFALPRVTALLIGVLFGLMVGTGFLALRHLPVAVYIVVVYIYPALVVVAGAVMGHHRPTRLTWIALAVVMVGVVLTVPELFGGVGSISALGVALTLLQAVMMAAFMIVSTRLMPAQVDGVVRAFWNLVGGALGMVPFVLVGGFTGPDTALLVGEVLLFALVPTVIASIFFFRALRRTTAGVVAMMMTLEVVFAILWSVLFLGESVSAVKVLGAAVVVVGVMLAQREGRQSGDDPTGELKPVI